MSLLDVWELLWGGIKMVKLWGSSGAYQMPLPTFGSADPSFLQAPAVWTVTGGEGGMGSHAQMVGYGQRSSGDPEAIC